MKNLRIKSRCGKKITLRVNGRSMTAYEGDSVHAALLAGGVGPLRKTLKKEQPRGIFCGMGVCYECLVTVNGVPNVRACMTTVEDRMEIETDEF